MTEGSLQVPLGRCVRRGELISDPGSWLEKTSMCASTDPLRPRGAWGLESLQTHLCGRRVLVQAPGCVGLRQRVAPQHGDVQSQQQKSQEQQQLRRQPHHPLDAAALRRFRRGRSPDSASYRCRDSDLRIRRGRGAATPLRSHFGIRISKTKGKRIQKEGMPKKVVKCLWGHSFLEKYFPVFL